MKHGSSAETSVPSPDGYFWTNRGGDDRTSSSVPYAAPTDFSKGPAWTWDNALDEQVRHSPLIDDKKNVYVMTTQRLRKFTSDGELLWTKQYPECKLTASPALHNGAVFLLCPKFGDAHVMTVKALSMDSGDPVWTKAIEGADFAAGGDSQSVLAHNGTIVVPMHNGRIGDGTNVWYAMNSSTGDYLWDYQADEVYWNAVPATPGDGTLLFSGSCGGASRIAFGGKLLWRAGPPKKVDGNGHIAFCGTGGGSVGPNGVYYAEHTKDDGSGHIAAYQISDGKFLWERNFGPNYQGNQYPAVGRLGSGGPLAVVVAIGNNPGLAPWMNIPQLRSQPALDKYLESSDVRKAMGVKPQVAAIVAMDAASGDVLWRWEEEPWDHIGAAGDEEAASLKRDAEHSPEGAICLPDEQGIPVIAGDGTVYASSSHGGDLTAIRDADGNGIIDPSEVSKLVTHKAFLNSPSLAPGMLVAAPCWGPISVFKA